MAADETAPVFILGAPRSGTGILHALLRLHPELGWVTPASNAMTGFCADRRLPLGLGYAAARAMDPLSTHLPRGALPKFLRGPFDGSLQGGDLPPAVEGSRIWIVDVPERDHHALGADDVTDRARQVYHEVVEAHRRRWGRPSVVFKDPLHSLRVPYLAEVFPEGRFVHLLRDGRAVAASVLRRRKDVEGWWGIKPPGWRDRLDDPVPVQCVWQWRETVQAVDDPPLPGPEPGTLASLRYRDLTEDPEAVLPRLLEALGLDPAIPEAVAEHLDELENRNDGWRRGLADEEAAAIEEAVDRPDGPPGIAPLEPA